MRHTSYRILLAALCLTLAAGALQAQPVKYAQAGMKFLTLDVGGRMAALGGTHATVSGGASAMFANPAGLAMLEGGDVLLSTTSWIADIKHYGGGAAFRVGNIGTFGVSVVSMDYGEFRRTSVYQGTDPDLRQDGYIDEGTFTVAEYAVGVTYARQITSQFYVGGQIKYAHQDLGSVAISDLVNGTIEVVDNKLGNLAFDFGTLFYPGFEDLRFGVSIRNFSNQADYYDQRFELPLTFDVGLAMNLLNLLPSAAGESSRSVLNVGVDWLHPRDFSERVHIGAEYGFMDAIFLRGGYKFNYDSEGLTAGVGVKVGTGGIGLKADYAYGRTDEFFGALHRVGIGLRFE